MFVNGVRTAKGCMNENCIKKGGACKYYENNGIKKV
jgi:hypothetical protein